MVLFSVNAKCVSISSHNLPTIFNSWPFLYRQLLWATFYKKMLKSTLQRFTKPSLTYEMKRVRNLSDKASRRSRCVERYKLQKAQSVTWRRTVRTFRADRRYSISRERQRPTNWIIRRLIGGQNVCKRVSDQTLWDSRLRDD